MDKLSKDEQRVFDHIASEDMSPVGAVEMLFDADGDFSGYAIPDCDPVSIDTKFVTKWGKDDELVYVVTWADGTVAEMFSISNDWHEIFVAGIVERSRANLRKLDATLSELRSTTLSQSLENRNVVA